MSTLPVTVLLAVHNGAATLAASVASILRQTHRELELLVIDDGSTDETGAVLRQVADPRLRVLKNERNLGLTRSLNRGLEEARGEWIARLDADDLCDSRRLEKQRAFLAAHPDVALLGSSAWRMNDAGRVTGANDLPVSHEAIRWAAVWDSPFLHPAVIFRRSVVRDLGGYDERYAIAQDYDLWTRLAARHRVANLPERLVFMREHPASMTRAQSARTTEEVAQLQAQNLAAAFPGRVFSVEEKRSIALLRLRFPASELPAVSALVDRLFAEYVRASGPVTPDLRATHCRLHLRLAHKFLAVDRRAAAGEIARSLRASPGEWMRQALTVVRCAAAPPSAVRYDPGSK